MMGTRGAVGLSQEAAGLAMLADLIALLKSADKTLPAAVADLRAAEADANNAREALEARQAEHDKRQAEIDARQVELSGHAKDLKVIEADVVAREDAAKTQEAENAQKQASFTGQAAAIAQRMSELVARDREIENLIKNAQQEIQSQKEALAAEREGAEQAIARALRENDVAMRVARDKAKIEIAKLRSIAGEAMEIDMESLRQREARVVELEAAIHDRSAKLSEALSRI